MTIDATKLYTTLFDMFAKAYLKHEQYRDIADAEETDMETFNHIMEEHCIPLQARYIAIADVAEEILGANLFALCAYLDE